MAKLRLEIEEETTLKLLGIQSNWSEHRLVWAINRQFGIQLQRSEDFFIESRADESNQVLFSTESKHFFSVFLYESDDEQAILVANIGQGLPLFDKRRKLDYMLKVSSKYLEESECIQKLNEIKGVLATTRIECDVDELAARPFSSFI